MMNSSLLSFVLLLLAVSPHAASRPTYTKCVNDITYAANSTYEANLRRLAAELSASQSSYTYRAVGFWPNRARASSFCRLRNDDGRYSCAACIAGAFRELKSACPYHKEAFFSDRNCTLQLSEVRLLGTESIHEGRKRTNPVHRMCTTAFLGSNTSRVFCIFSARQQLRGANVELFHQPLRDGTILKQTLASGLIFQVVGFAWLFFLALQEWRGRKRGTAELSTPLVPGDH